MNGKHFHTEWSFRVVYTKCGKPVGTQRKTMSDGHLFLTEEAARRGMELVASWENAYLKEHGCKGAYDAFEIYAPVRRIVTEWEDSDED